MSQPPSQQPTNPDDENQTEMYIRVKRNKTTYFLQCLPSEKVLQIKEKLQILIDQPVSNQRLILMSNGELLDDSKSLADQKVENDAAVALTLRKGDDEFEDVNVVRPDDYVRDGDGGSNCFCRFQVEETNGLVSELADVASQERAVLDECEALVASTGAMQALEYSLRTNLIQMKEAWRNQQLIFGNEGHSTDLSMIEH